MNKTTDYGKELILDLHECSTENFNRKELTRFFRELCELIDMERADLHFWDYEGEQSEYQKAPAHLKGTSAIQFITTSNITIHTLDELKRVYLNIFSCKDFDTVPAIYFCKEFFSGRVITSKIVGRI